MILITVADKVIKMILLFFSHVEYPNIFLMDSSIELISYSRRNIKLIIINSSISTNDNKTEDMIIPRLIIDQLYVYKSYTFVFIWISSIRLCLLINDWYLSSEIKYYISCTLVIVLIIDFLYI